MDTRKADCELIEGVLRDLTIVPYAHGDVRFVPAFDRDGGHFLVMLAGRDGPKRVHGCLAHVDLIDGRFWIERDGTERGIANDLLERGVPRNRIVLAWQPPESRAISGFAAV